MENFLHKIENIKLLREYFALQLNDIELNLKNKKTKNILKNKKFDGTLSQVNLSLQIIKDNISTLTNLIDSLNSENSKSLKKETSPKTNEINIIYENIVKLELVTNLFATEFIYINKKLEADIKSKKKIPIELQDEVEKMKFNLKIINNYTDNIQKLINNIHTNEKSITNIKKKRINKINNENEDKIKHKGFLTTIAFIKKRILFANKIEYLLGQKKHLSNKNKSLSKINPEEILKNNEINISKQLKDNLIEEYKYIKAIRNVTFHVWQPLINEVINYTLNKYSQVFEQNPKFKYNFLKDIKQILAANLIDGLDLLIFPQKHTLVKRLKTYINNEFKKLQTKNYHEIHFSEFNKINNDQEDTKDEINNVHIFINKQKHSNQHELTPEHKLLDQEKNIKLQSEFWKDVISYGKRIKLYEEVSYLQDFFDKANKNSNNRINNLDFFRDYNKRKIKGSLGLLIKFVEAKHILQGKI